VEPFFLFTLRFKDSYVSDSGTELLEVSETSDVIVEAGDIASEEVEIVAASEVGEAEENGATTKADSPYPLDTLTPREMEVVELICLGYTNRDISKMLFISEHTVKDHTKKIYPKLGVHSRFELATLVNRYKKD